MGDQEIELAAKFGIPEFAGFALGLEGTYRGTLGGRRRRHVRRIEELTGLSVEQLVSRLEADERLRDIFLGTLERTSVTADEEYADALARLVAGALDGARISEVDYMVSQILRLEPLHLRTLRCLFKLQTRGDLQPEPILVGGQRSTGALRTDLGVSLALVVAVIEVLRAAGLVEPTEGVIDGGSLGLPVDKTEELQWQATQWGARIIDHLFPEHDVFVTLGRGQDNWLERVE